MNISDANELVNDILICFDFILNTKEANDLLESS